jgi:hypothetical protein
VYFEQAPEQVYKKLSGDKHFSIQDSPMYSSQGRLAYLMYFAQKQFQIFKIFTKLFVFINDSLAKNTLESLLESLSKAIFQT